MQSFDFYRPNKRNDLRKYNQIQILYFEKKCQYISFNLLFNFIIILLYFFLFAFIFHYVYI